MENMNEGIKNVVNDVVAADKPVAGNGVGIAIGVGMALAIGVGGFLIKMAYDACTGGKDKNEPDNDHEDEETDETATK